MLDQEFGKGWVQYCTMRKFSDPKLFWAYNSATSKGKDPTKV